MAKKPLFQIGETKVFGNNHLVPITYGFELSEKEKKEFNYLEEEELESASFFRYKGNVYNLGEFGRVEKNHPFFKIFDGFTADTFFSGIAIKIVDEDFVKVYTTYC